MLINTKGKRNETCNDTNCNNSHAIHYNCVTEAYYCTPCARRINKGCEEDKLICAWPKNEVLDDDGFLKPEKITKIKDVAKMSLVEKDNAIHSARYILEDLNDEGKTKLAEITGMPIGVIHSAFDVIFKEE